MRIGKNNKLYMIKGDTEPLYLTLSDGIFESGDIVYLTIKKNISTETIDLQKIFNVDKDTDTINYIFSSDDTKNLISGNYKYEIKVKDKSGNYSTLIQGLLFLGDSFYAFTE